MVGGNIKGGFKFLGRSAVRRAPNANNRGTAGRGQISQMFINGAIVMFGQTVDVDTDEFAGELAFEGI